MTAATLTPAPSTPARSRITITRTGVFAVLFILLGAFLLLTGPSSLAPETITTLTFGDNLPQLPIPTLGFLVVMAIYYIAVGGFSLLPLPDGSRLKLVRFLLLLLGGILLIPAVLIAAAADNTTNMTVMLSVSIRLATPIVLGALAGLWCERAGVVNVAIEGMMLTGACFGFTGFTLLLGMGMDSGPALFLGVVIACLSGGLMSVLHAWLSITFKTDQVVSGTVINILALGVTSFTRREVLFSSEAGRETLQQIRIPVLADIPIIGDILFNGRPIFYAMFIILIVSHIVLFYTRWGLRTRAVGENPRAADTLGVNVIRTRWINVMIGGLIAGLAGAWFSLETTGSFDDNMTSGRGFIGLAALIFGKWTPFGAFGGGLLFGFSDALGQRFQVLGVAIPPQFLQMVPYVITIVVLAGLVGRAVGPKASGIPYEKEGK